MSRLASFSILMVLLLLVAFQAQAEEAKKPGVALIGIYNIAPGKHMDFLKWMAAREEAAKAAGVPATVWYAHTDGGSWDYIAIAPVVSDEQSKKVDEVSAKMGLTVGFKASLEFRQFVSSHTDTYTMGPVSAADLVKAGQ